MKKIIFNSITIVLLLIINLYSFAQKAKISAEPRYMPKYNYQPPKREPASNSNITIALMTPVFLINNEKVKSEEPYRLFANKMVNDIEAMLSAKGYNVRGPFNSRDEMVISDKNSSDFLLEIAFDYNATVQRSWKYYPNLLSLSASTYSVTNGNVNVSTTLVVTAKSNYSGEKFWKKNIDLESKSFSYRGSVRWDSQDLTFNRELNQDNNFWNPMTKELENLYNEAMELLWKQFDVSEFKLVAEEARKEKSKM